MEKSAFPTADTEKMMRLPVGVISPLWLMFAGAATMGAAYYWGRSLLKATNLEALTAVPEAAVEAVVEAAPEVVEPPVEAAPEGVDAVVETAPEATEVLAETVPETPDDLTALTGIGSKLAAAFAERGVTRFAHIAAWTEEDVARFDKELKLMGRVTREAWIAQATQLAGQ